MKIKDTYVGIFFLIAIIIVIIFISVTTRYNESLSETTTNNYHSEFVKDSLKTEQIKKQIALRDSIILYYENKAKIESEKGSILKKQIADLKTKNKEIYSKYSENSTIENCDSVILNQKEIVLLEKEELGCYDQLINEYNFSWVHVSFVSNKKNRKQILVIK